ncbi:MAG: energy-coupling factor transporter transmembrane protein EcfT [Clostridiales Family XIII bacterium]|jgi:energy-coupling factor transport system permease protein|nr:energy-coupling factor transporter transmembrane protein EcfT [Clostridiales Family XIII bacterium]
MIRDITIGQYYPGYSQIHKLDTRLKILLTFGYMVSVFLAKDFLAYLVIFLSLCLVVATAEVPFRFILRGLRPVFLIIAFTFVLNLFMTQGTDLVRIGALHITREGVYTACYMALRIIFLIIGCSLLTFTTKPVKLTDGIEALLKPFVRFGLPAHELAMMMTIALRFIPTLLEETDKIMKAQQARGADFETGSIFRRAKAMVPIFIPLIVGAFRMASDLAMAMEARCYRGGEGRTKMHVFRFGRKDAQALALFCIYLAVILVERIFDLQTFMLEMLRTFGMI